MERRIASPRGPRGIIGILGFAIILAAFSGRAYAQTTFTVNTTTDADVGGAVNGSTVDCTVTGAPCTLRAAIDQGANVVNLPAGTYYLTYANRPDGVFGLFNELSIAGAGAETTIIDNSQTGTRLFQVYSPALHLSGLTIQNSSRYDYGGVIYGGSAGLTLDNVVMQGNSSGDWGGAIYTAGPTTITNSTFYNNSSCSGGAIFFDNYGGGATLTVTNSTFVGNYAYCDGNTLTSIGTSALTNVTVLGDTAPGSLGYLTYVPNISSYGNLTLKSSILADDSNVNCNGNFSSLGYNLSDDGSCGSDAAQVTDAQLALDPNGLQNNGGQTPTVALESGSVAINYVAPSACPPPATDQRGITRPQGPSCDSGAFEAVAPLTGNISGPVNVGPGQTVTVLNGKLSGSTTIAAGGTLSLTGDSSATGPITVAGTLALSGGSTTSGQITLSGSGALTVSGGSSVGGNLTLASGQTATFTNGSATGNVTMNGGALSLTNSTAGKNLTVNDGTLTTSGNTSIQGNLQVSGGGSFAIGPGTVLGNNFQVQNLTAASGQNQICGASVSGNLLFQDNAAAVEIGSTTPSLCAGNMIDGNLTVQSNTAPTIVSGNTVTGTLIDQSNTGATEVFGNAVGKNLQCQSNTSITGGGNTAKSKQGQCASF